MLTNQPLPLRQNNLTTTATYYLLFNNNNLLNLNVSAYCTANYHLQVPKLM